MDEFAKKNCQAEEIKSMQEYNGEHIQQFRDKCLDFSFLESAPQNQIKTGNDCTDKQSLTDVSRRWYETNFGSSTKRKTSDTRSWVSSEEDKNCK